MANCWEKRLTTMKDSGGHGIKDVLALGHMVGFSFID
jgi:hypothetical protein